MNTHTRYRFTCTLSFGDIYGQIIVWLIVICRPGCRPLFDE